MENYQGSEALVTIISAVMSGPPPGATSKKSFIDDPKSFNVALSRAKALCVVVGNIDYLSSTGSYWSGLIEVSNVAIEEWGATCQRYWSLCSISNSFLSLQHCRKNYSIAGDESSSHTAFEKQSSSAYVGVDALLEWVELNGLGARCEEDRLERALRGYSAPDDWKVQL